MADNKELAPGGYKWVRELRDKIRFLLDTYGLYDEDGMFTFPDGDTWTRPSE